MLTFSMAHLRNYNIPKRIMQHLGPNQRTSHPIHLRADDKSVAICYINSMLQKLYAFAKLFNRMIDRAICIYYLKLSKLVYNIFISNEYISIIYIYIY